MGTKAALHDEGGSLLASAFEESVLRYPRAGWVEQDPDEIYGSVLRTVRETLERGGVVAGAVAAIAIDGQMAGVCTIDADWVAATHYDSWLDTRWKPDLLREFGLTTEKLPRIVEPWDVVGHVTARAAGLIGLRAGRPVAAGCGDQAVNVLCAGLVHPSMV